MSTTLPCGCVLDQMVVNGENVLTLTACAAGAECKWVKFTLAETAKQNKRSTIIDAS